MKRIFLNDLNLSSKFHVYDNYEFKKDNSFLENDFYVPDDPIFNKYTEWNTKEFIPYNFFNAPLYAENEKKEVKRQENKSKKGYAYLVAKNIFLSSEKDHDVSKLLSLKETVNVYD